MASDDRAVVEPVVSGPSAFDYEVVELGLAGQVIPVVVGFGADGTRQTARALAERAAHRLPPAECDHAGAAWSANLVMRCQRCGAEMFLPPRLLAYLPAEMLAVMHELWAAAGWPVWRGQAWCVNKYWAVVRHPLFDHCGGLPVRHDRWLQYDDARRALDE